MSKPYGPKEISKILPDFVYDAVNELLSENLDSSVTTIYQDDLQARIIAKADGMEFQQKWLDIELPYRAAGWKVTYDKPAYNETGRAYFEFSEAK